MIESSQLAAVVAKSKAENAVEAARYVVRRAVADLEESGEPGAALEAYNALASLDRAAIEVRNIAALADTATVPEREAKESSDE